MVEDVPEQMPKAFALQLVVFPAYQRGAAHAVDTGVTSDPVTAVGLGSIHRLRRC